MFIIRHFVCFVCSSFSFERINCSCRDGSIFAHLTNIHFRSGLSHNIPSIGKEVIYSGSWARAPPEHKFEFRWVEKEASILENSSKQIILNALTSRKEYTPTRQISHSEPYHFQDLIIAL